MPLHEGLTQRALQKPDNLKAQLLRLGTRRDAYRVYTLYTYTGICGASRVAVRHSYAIWRDYCCGLFVCDNARTFFLQLDTHELYLGITLNDK